MTVRQSVHDLVLRPARQWGRIFVSFAAVQAIAQLLAAVSGILVVRLLTRDDYALYTIGNTMLATLVLLADSGVGAAVAGIGGRVWDDAFRLGRTINAAFGIRNWLRNVLALPVTLLLLVLLLKNGATPKTVAVIIPIVLISAVLALDAGVYIVVPRLKANTRLLQGVALGSAASRLVTTIAFGLIGLSAATAMLSVVAGYAVQRWLTMRWAKRQADLTAPPDPLAAAELKGVLRRQMPHNIYYILQTQISVWLLSIFGSTASVAGLGALARIGVVFVVLSAAMEGVVVPRYARCTDPARLATLYIQILTGFAALVTVPAIFVAVMPGPVLWVLGPQYDQLSWELILATLSCALTALNGVSWSLNATRAWVVPPSIYIPVGLALQAFLLFAIGVSTIERVLTMTICVNLVQTIMCVATSVAYIRRFRRQSHAAAMGHGGLPSK